MLLAWAEHQQSLLQRLRQEEHQLPSVPVPGLPGPQLCFSPTLCCSGLCSGSCNPPLGVTKQSWEVHPHIPPVAFLLQLNSGCPVFPFPSSVPRYMCSSVLQRALAAPLVWILLALLDGKCFVCAFSSSVDPEKFLDFANMTPSQVQLFLAKVPCKEDELVRNSPARKAVSRYLRCLSQVIRGGGVLSLPWDMSCTGSQGHGVRRYTWFPEAPFPVLETQPQGMWSLWGGKKHDPHKGQCQALGSGHFAINTDSPQGGDQVSIPFWSQLGSSPGWMAGKRCRRTALPCPHPTHTFCPPLRNNTNYHL